ncbi:predicted protein [Streptomyces viridochromogenes DSM 40736]|uniref:Predicted protein n=1 Tax=Streptomyces viridochromogenes (strain DSM 40736 / JCM 4977 / BCRC 1201 / Tue 494) TaxID=591159 RepID=D9X4D1_STRVT|nr:predicted protein [Streptomyces viridochromogenes DSM 40736]
MKPLSHHAVIVSRGAGQSGWSRNRAAVRSSRRVRADWLTAARSWWTRRSPIAWTVEPPSTREPSRSASHASWQAVVVAAGVRSPGLLGSSDTGCPSIRFDRLRR